MQNFILITLILGLAFFLYLLKIGEINRNDFNVKSLKGSVEFVIRKSPSNSTNSSSKSSDIFAHIKGQEFKVFTFSGNDFRRLIKSQYPLDIYQVPIEAIDAIAGTWIGNRYIFYIISSIRPDTGAKYYDIYRAEYPTDNISRLEFYKIKSVAEADVDETFKVTY